MPQIKSAKKRVAQTSRKTARNRAHRQKLKKAVKTFKATLSKGGPEGLPAAVGTVQKALDKAGVKGILHKNAVNRRKSRSALAANKAAKATGPAKATRAAKSAKATGLAKAGEARSPAATGSGERVEAVGYGPSEGRRGTGSSKPRARSTPIACLLLWAISPAFPIRRPRTFSPPSFPGGRPA